MQYTRPFKNSISIRMATAILVALCALNDVRGGSAEAEEIFNTLRLAQARSSSRPLVGTLTDEYFAPPLPRGWYRYACETNAGVCRIDSEVAVEPRANCFCRKQGQSFAGKIQ
jgi:hypothetical protein